jgi:hypothetical protein
VKDDKNNFIWNYCKKPGHLKAKCFKLLKKNQSQGEINSGGTKNNVAGAVADVVLSSVEKVGFNHGIWISDSGASRDYCNNDNVLYDNKVIFEGIMIGNGNAMISEKKRKLRCEILQKNGESLTVLL